MKDQLRLCGMCLLGITLALLVAPPSTAGESPQASAPGVPADWWAEVQAEIEQVEYSITWQDQTYLPGSPEAFQAPNRAENLRTYFEPGGPTVLPRLWPEDLSDPPWRWELRLAAWGREEMEPVPAASLEVKGNLIEYRRGPLVEWYRNDGDGLAQGFRLSVSPPAGGSPATKINISYKTEEIEWVYDPEIAQYRRWMDFKEHLDANTEEQVTVSNVIYMTPYHVNDANICEQINNGVCAALSIEIQLWGSGPAVVFRDGQRYDVTWQRVGRNDQLTFTDAQGDPFPLQIGQSCVQVVPGYIPNSLTVTP